MNFQTQIPLKKQTENQIGYRSKLLLLGSCFVENMGNKFEYFKFQSKNPFGIIFNPVSLENLIKRIAEKRTFTEEDLFQHNELWHCFEVHSQLSHPDKATLLKTLNDKVESTYQNIVSSTHCIITLGTAWVYRFNATQNIVANCHKVPQKQFEKELLSVETIEKSLKNMVKTIGKINPDCQVIFTVSPVRHIKDGFVENQLSKAHLITSLHSLLKTEICDCQLNYFPSYEIMMDELRDYRFYADDMLHPNTTAVNHIWNRFCEVWMADETFKTMKQVDTVQKGHSHKPFNPNTKAHQAFLKDLETKKAKLKAQFSHIQF